MPNTESQPNSRESSNVSKVPPQYRDLDYEIVSEIMPRKMYLDPAIQATQDERRREILEAIDKEEEKAQREKLAAFGAEYNSVVLSGNPTIQEGNKNRFAVCQKEAQELVVSYIKGEPCISILPDEEYLINQIRDLYLQTRLQNPGSTVNLQFRRKARELFFNNLQYRVAFDLFKGNQGSLSPATAETLVKEAAPEPEFTGELNVRELDTIRGFSKKKSPETQETYEASLDRAISWLEKRPSIEGIENDNPTIVISDLHTRRGFLANVLSQKVAGDKTVLELLKEGKINIVCVGDGMHSEDPANWAVNGFVYRIDDEIVNSKDPLTAKLTAYKSKIETEMGESVASAARRKDFVKIKRAKDKYPVSAELEADVKKNLLDNEMVRGLGLMQMIMELKTAYPEAFHFIRGNHDDVKSQISGVEKYANESADVKKWIIDTYGEDFLEKFALFERSLPSVVKQGKKLIVSHALPDEALSPDAILARDKKSIQKLMWTENRDADRANSKIPKPPIDQRVVKANIASLGANPDALWVVGHRDVEAGTKYRAQFDEQVIQINDKVRQLVTLFDPKKTYKAASNTFDLSSEKLSI